MKTKKKDGFPSFFGILSDLTSSASAHTTGTSATAETTASAAAAKAAGRTSTTAKTARSAGRPTGSTDSGSGSAHRRSGRCHRPGIGVDGSAGPCGCMSLGRGRSAVRGSCSSSLFTDRISGNHRNHDNDKSDKQNDSNTGKSNGSILFVINISIQRAVVKINAG